MATINLIQMKRSATPDKVPTTSDLALGEFGINTYDGRVYIKKDDGAASIIEVGNQEAQAVYYVSKSGNDANDGKTLGRAKLTIKSAVEATKLMVATATVSVSTGVITGLTVTNGGAGYVDTNPPRVTIFGDGVDAEVTAIVSDGQVTGFEVVNGGSGYTTASAYIMPSGSGATIFVKAGDYTEDNPIFVPKGVCVVGDSLRSVTIRPQNTTLDLFWVNNRSYFTEMTYRDHEYPAAAFSFPSVNIANIEKTSPVRVKFSRGFVFNRAKCARDIGLIIESLAQDARWPSSTGDSQSLFAGLQYWNQSGNLIPTNQIAPTLAALAAAKTSAQSIITTSAEDATVGALFDLIIDILDGTIDVATVTDLIVPNGTTASVNADVIAAEAALANAVNINTIKNAATAAAGLTVSDPAYATCQRDVGYILQSIRFDLLYGGNRQAIQSGVYYYDFSPTASAIANEIPQTVQAYTYLKTIISNVVRELPIAVYQTAVSQDTSGTASTLLVANAINANVDQILDILQNGPNAYLPPNVGILTPIGINNEVGNTSNARYAYNQLIANKDFITAELLAYIDAEAVLYDQATCERDTGLIVDAIVQDLLFDGSSQSAFAGIQYWSQSGTVIPTAELTPTINTFYDYVRVLTNEITTNTVAAFSAVPRYSFVGMTTQNTALTAAGSAPTSINTNFLLFKTILTDGTAGVTDLIVPNDITASSNVDINRAYDLIQANKEYIKEQTIRYINATYPSLVYDTVKCARDTGYVLDSIIFDMLYTGNRQTIQSAVYYYSYSAPDTVIPGEQSMTVAAFNYIKTMSSYIVMGQAVPTLYQGAVTQTISGNVGTQIELAAINDNINLINDIIAQGPTVAPEPTPIMLDISTDQSVINAATELHDNRAFIVAEVVAFINENFLSYHPYSNGDAISIRGVEGMTEINNGYIHTIINVTNSLPTQVTFDKGHTFDNRASLRISGVLGMLEINGNRYYAKWINTDTIELFRDVNLTEPVDSTFYGTYTSGGQAETDSFYYVRKINSTTVDLYLDTALSKPLDSTADIASTAWGTYTGGGIAGTGALPISPYVHNCSSITTTGTGMRVDGNLSAGLKSMVLDSFTQINEGGNGIEIINRGYAQLVSIYTICTDIGVLCKDGGICSVANSDSSFGTYALVSDGLSEVLYSAKTDGDLQVGKIINLKGMTHRPNYGDAMDITSALVITDATIVVASADVSSPGTGYAPGDILTVTGTTGTDPTLRVSTVQIVGTPTIGSQTGTWAVGDRITFTKGFSTPAVVEVATISGSAISTLTVIEPGVKNTAVLPGSVVADITPAGTTVSLDLTFGVESVGLTSNVGVITAIPANPAVTTNTGTGTGATVNVTYSIRLTFADAHYFRGDEEITIANLAGMTNINSQLYFGKLTGIANKVDLHTDSTLVNGVDVDGFGTFATTTLSGVTIAGTSGQFSCTASSTPLAVGQPVVISGTFGGTGSIVGYENPSTYWISATDGSTTFTLTNSYSNAIEGTNTLTTTAGTPTGLTYSLRGIATLHDYYTVITATNGSISSTTGLQDSQITLEISIKRPLENDTIVKFRQRSAVSSSGHTFEFIGSGNILSTATPESGAYPIAENEVVELRGGKVYFTGTNEQGDFKIGTELVINRDTGTISGRTFNKSLFAVLTPYILALEG